MKYYLIIGYQLQEKYLTFPTVNVSINDTLVDSFLCDNEESVICKNVFTEFIDFSSHAHKKTQTESRTTAYSTPSKLQIYEIDSSTFNDRDDVLKIEVTENYSDYTNGFLNKRSLVVLNPIFLIPKDLLHNLDSMHKLINKFHHVVMDKGPGRMQRTKKYRFTERVVWPGYSAYPDHGIYSSDNITVPVSGGGNFKISLNIKKRLGLHFLTHHNEIPKGFFFCDYFFMAWYQWQSKKYFTMNARLEDDYDKGTLVSTLDMIVKNNINTDNEDK